MMRTRLHSVRKVSRWLSVFGGALLGYGALLGWFGPWLGNQLAHLTVIDISLAPLGNLLQGRVVNSGIDTTGFLQADVAALAVIIAVLIGFNVTMVQIAGQTLSLGLVRSILVTATPFLIAWSIASTVALSFFLIPPVFNVQLWQMLIWFVAIIVLMIGYLWSLAWHLSGQYAAQLATRELSGLSLTQWDKSEGYAILQSAIASSTARRELVAMRDMAFALANFLVTFQDKPVSNKATLASTAKVLPDRARYRALKNLLSGCAEHADNAPNSVAYALGFVAAGASLQATACGLRVGEANTDLFSGIFKALRGHPERLTPIFTGMRHSFCRESAAEPYLLQFWTHRTDWPCDDPGWCAHIACCILVMHTHCWRGLRTARTTQEAAAEVFSPNEFIEVDLQSTVDEEEAGNQDATMLVKLYRDVAEYLAPAVNKAIGNGAISQMGEFPRNLLKAIHKLALTSWYPWASVDGKHAVDAAYAKYCGDDH